MSTAIENHSLYNAGGEGIAAITSRKLLEAEIIRGKIDI